MSPDFLLEHGADVNAADWWGRTPLWAAVEIRNLELTSRGGEHGVDRARLLKLITMPARPRRESECAHRGSASHTPLHHAASAISPGSISPVRHRSCARRSPGDMAVMRLLLEKGADPEYPDVRRDHAR